MKELRNKKKEEKENVIMLTIGRATAVDMKKIISLTQFRKNFKLDSSNTQCYCNEMFICSG